MTRSILPRTGRTVAARWAAQGLYNLTELEADVLDNPVHERIRHATVSGRAFHDVQGVIAATQDWAWPRYYLDFETIALAAPRWIGARPYQAIPFQFSCHVEAIGQPLRHGGFLSLDGRDPRRSCANTLIHQLGGAGAIIAYNAAFERRCILDLAAHLPDLAPELTAIAARVVDLLPVTRAHYYHRDQRGSWSIKAVLPTIAPELSYDGLEVGDGVMAQLAWMEAQRPTTSPLRCEQIRAALEAYCERDTLAMVVMLERLCRPPPAEMPAEAVAAASAGAIL